MHLYLYNADKSREPKICFLLLVTINKILCQFFEFTQNLKRSRSLARNDFPQVAETDIVFSSKPVSFKNNPSLAKRLRANICEWCGKYTTDVVMHQVSALKDLDKSLPWNLHMIKINRKTLVVCPDCHKKIHLYEN